NPYLPNLERLQELDQRHPVGLAESSAVFVAAIRVAGQTCVKGKGARKGAPGFDPDMHRVEFPAANKKDLRPLRRWEQEVVKARHRAVVQIRRGRPSAVQRSGTIGEDAAKFIWSTLINLVFRLSIRRRLVLPLLDNTAGHFFGRVQ